MIPRFLLLILIFCLPAGVVWAQDYEAVIGHYRQDYKKEFLSSEHSPLKAEDTGLLQFFPVDARYNILADFVKTPGQPVFDMPTYSGKVRKYRKYGELRFWIDDRELMLEVYQSPELMKRKELKDYLFIPFRDLTNGVSSYGGGRYMELRTGQILEGNVLLDFNKSYNPYCAYADGYNCPIPPEVNHLPVAIPAGEMQFAGHREE